MTQQGKDEKQNKNKQCDVDRMTNEGLAGGWEGDFVRNGRIHHYADFEEEAPPTLNGKPLKA